MPDTFQEYRAKLLDRDAHRYMHSSGESKFVRDEGLLVLPVMGPSGTAPRVMRVHAPFGVRSSVYDGAATGRPPLLPAPGDTGDGDTLMTSSYTFPIPRPNEDGSAIFGVRAEHTYVQPDGGRGAEDTFPMDKHPFPTILDMIEELPPPTGNAADDVDWHWNVAGYPMTLLGTYNLFG